MSILERPHVHNPRLEWGETTKLDISHVRDSSGGRTEVQQMSR